MLPRRTALKNIRQAAYRFRQRARIAQLCLGLLTVLLLGRLLYLQVYQHQKYQTLSTKNQIRLVPIAPKRGLIYDRHGQLLAENLPTFSLDIIPEKVPNLANTLQAIQTLIPLSPADLQGFHKQRSLHRRFDSIPLKVKLSPQELARFSLNAYRFPGVHVTTRLLRHYPMGASIVSALGYVGRINKDDIKQLDAAQYAVTQYLGKTGVERFYESLLHGQVGYANVEINASGRPVRQLGSQAPISGDTLILTLDAQLQQIADTALAGERGAIVALDPSNGEIIALVSHPSFDPNQFIQGISNAAFAKLQNSPDKPLYNRALRGQFPLASTIKPFLALAGLDQGWITPKTTIDDPGWFQLANTSHLYRDWKPNGHGRVDVRTAIIVSCDTFFYQLAVKMGMSAMHDILTRFGFGRPPGIDVKEALNGLIPSPAWKRIHKGSHWYTGDTIISGIGQGYLLTTPLQLAVATAALANRGGRITPHLLRERTTAAGQHIPYHSPPLDPVMLQHQRYWDTVISAMEGVIKSTTPWGTGYRFGRDAPYRIAGKTGTAQLYHVDHSDHPTKVLKKRLRDHSLFIGFAPIKHPKIAVAIVVENSPIAPRIARIIIDHYLAKTQPFRE